MAEKIVIQVQADTTQAVKGIDKVDESIKDVNKSSADTSNTLDKMSGGAITTFKNFKSGLAWERLPGHGGAGGYCHLE